MQSLGMQSVMSLRSTNGDRMRGKNEWNPKRCSVQKQIQKQRNMLDSEWRVWYAPLGIGLSVRTWQCSAIGFEFAEGIAPSHIINHPSFLITISEGNKSVDKKGGFADDLPDCNFVAMQELALFRWTTPANGVTDRSAWMDRPGLDRWAGNSVNSLRTVGCDWTNSGCWDSFGTSRFFVDR